MDRSLKLSLLDAFLYSLMVGLGETYLPAYVLSIGLGEIYAGLLASLPLLSGALLQLFAPKGLEVLRSTKQWIVISTAMQACAFLPLVYFTLNFSTSHDSTTTPPFWMLFLILTLYWGSGFAASPAWNYWMGHLVPIEISTKFFSRRTRILQSGILLGLVLGGVALHNNVRLGSMTSVFTGLFIFAFICRLLSSLALAQKRFLPAWEQPASLSLLRSWIVFRKRAPQNLFFKYLFFYMMAVFISSPFVTPYMLAQVKMSYGDYMVAIASLMVGKIVMLYVLEKMKQQKSGADLLMLGLMTVSPLPMLWPLSQNFAFICGLQLASGMAWACLEVGLALIFFKDLSPKEKIPFLTFYNFLNSMSTILGTGIGAVVLWFFHERLQTYQILFSVGGFLRVLLAAPLVIQTRNWAQRSLRQVQPPMIHNKEELSRKIG